MQALQARSSRLHCDYDGQVDEYDSVSNSTVNATCDTDLLELLSFIMDVAMIARHLGRFEQAAPDRD